MAPVIFILLIIWLSVLSVFVLRMIRHYNSLTTGVTPAGLKTVLDELLVHQKQTNLHAKALETALKKVHAEGKLHIQKIGLVRFNPFSDTGGSQSFTLALLDGRDTGLVMTSLYARTGHRWYIKEIVQAKGKAYALSKEETDAIKAAQTM